MKPCRCRRRWTSDEESCAQELLRTGKTYSEIGQVLGRTRKSVAHRNVEKWNAVQVKPHWTEEEERQAREMLSNGCPYRDVSREIGRSITALRKKNARDWRISNMKPRGSAMEMTPGKMYADRRRFDGKRHRILKRDNYTCQDCGVRDATDSILNVHHLDGNGRGNKKPNNDLDNLVTLCVSCHTKRHFRKEELIYGECKS